MWHWGPIVARTCCTHNIAQGHSDRGGTHQGWQGLKSKARLREQKRRKIRKEQNRCHLTFATALEEGLAPLTLVTWRHRSCCTAEHVSGQLLAPESQTRQSSSRHSQEGKQLFLPSFFLLSSRRKTESNDSLIEDFLIVYLCGQCLGLVTARRVAVSSFLSSSCFLQKVVIKLGRARHGYCGGHKG